MTKQEIIDAVNKTTVDRDLKDMVISYVDISYSAGFNDGMKQANEINASVHKMLMGKYAGSDMRHSDSVINNLPERSEK